MKQVMSTLLSSSFLVNADPAAFSALSSPKPGGLEALKEAMQDRIHIVLKRLLQMRYGLESASPDPDVIITRGDASGVSFVTYIDPMPSRKQGGTNRMDFLRKINDFLGDMRFVSQGKMISAGEIVNEDKLGLEYYPVDMGQAMACLVDNYLPKDPVARKAMEELSVLCSRFGNGQYVPANKLH